MAVYVTMKSASAALYKTMTFQDHEYELYTDLKSYDDIVGAAGSKSNGCGTPAHLVTISSSKENDAVYSMLEGTQSNYGEYSVVFIGLHDRVAQMKWEWITGEPNFFTNWAVNEPHDHGNGEYCANLGYLNLNLWQSIPCDREYYYVLEYDTDSKNCPTQKSSIVIPDESNARRPLSEYLKSEERARRDCSPVKRYNFEQCVSDIVTKNELTMSYLIHVMLSSYKRTV